jgi:hypothetical protein
MIISGIFFVRFVDKVRIVIFNILPSIGLNKSLCSSADFLREKGQSFFLLIKFNLLDPILNFVKHL